MKVHMLNGLRKHDLLGANIVEEAPSYMVRYDLNTMENDIDCFKTTLQPIKNNLSGGNPN